ncbi:MAG: TIGR03905 family TSCPD domain-containing protein [Clostridia bacterium]|nr:TIGR03905 family TSCPD domain-containing protein [Clostridia bacterium]
MFTYSTRGTCSRQILFDVDADNKMHNVRFIGGCSGNLQGIARLAEGKDIDELQTLLAGIRCKGNTSCPDQLSKAIAQYKVEKAALDSGNN